MADEADEADEVVQTSPETAAPSPASDLTDLPADAVAEAAANLAPSSEGHAVEAGKYMGNLVLDC